MKEDGETCVMIAAFIAILCIMAGVFLSWVFG